MTTNTKTTSANTVLHLDIENDGTWSMLDPRNESDELAAHERNDLGRGDLDEAVRVARAAGHTVTMRARKLRELRLAGLRLVGVVETHEA